mmetsp:Transcript_97329/g.187696  ORF Transcript_97329/g.187696 Transcript_97329/m.187696 type:complete len:890 (+) Transcript_97329:45-2714(+)
MMPEKNGRARGEKKALLDSRENTEVDDDESETEETEEGEEEDVKHEYVVAPEKLEDEEWQYLAFCLACVAVPLYMWSQSKPLSCVEIGPEEARWTHWCHGLTGKLHMTSFCMRSCMKSQAKLFMFTEGLAIALQLVALLMNHPGCAAWMNVIVAGDMQRQVAQAQESVDHQAAKAKEKGGMKVALAKWTVDGHLLTFFAHLRKVAALNFRYNGKIRPMYMLLMSMMLTSLSLVQMCIYFFTNMTTYPVMLYCDTNHTGTEDMEPLALDYTFNWTHFIFAALAALLLCIAMWLQFKGVYTKQVEIQASIPNVKGFKELFFEQKGVYLRQDLRLQRRSAEDAGTSPSSPAKPDFSHAVTKRLTKMVTSDHDDTDAKEKEKEKENKLEMKLEMLGKLQKTLARLHFHKLRFVTFRTEKGKKRLRAAEAWEEKKWDGPVVLHFVSRNQIRLPENRHTTAGMMLSFVAIICLFSSAKLCWHCVEGIHMEQILTKWELQKLVGLVGACGRHIPVGVGSLIGFLLMLAAFMLQGMLFKLADPQFQCGDSVIKAIGKVYPREVKERQLWFGVKSNNRPLDHKAYIEADAAQPKIWCHVWVKKHQEHDREHVQDCDTVNHASGGKGEELELKELEEDRKRWIKSTMPTEVQLRAPPSDAKLQRCIRGLLRDELGMPVLCIVTPREHFKTLEKDKQDFESLKRTQEEGEEPRPLKMQLVPMQFVGGSPCMWVNLGSKIIWEKLIGAFAFAAFLFPAAEVIYEFCLKSRTVKTCADILNVECVFFDNSDAAGHPIDFRIALGFKSALCGCICAMLASLCVRVAAIRDEPRNSEKAKGCLWACSTYIKSMGYYIRMFLNFVCWWPCSCWCPTRESEATEEKNNMNDLEFEDLEEVPPHAGQ